MGRTWPAIALQDIDNDGGKEIVRCAQLIFGSWTQNGSNQLGKLHILDYQGNQVYEVTLPVANVLLQVLSGKSPRTRRKR